MEHQEKINLNKAIDIFKAREFELEMTRPKKKFKELQKRILVVKSGLVYLVKL